MFGRSLGLPAAALSSLDRQLFLRVPSSGVLAKDAQAALRTAMLGDVVPEIRASKWNGGSRSCPHCVFHRFWVCPRWAPVRAAALGWIPGRAEAFVSSLPLVTALTGWCPSDPALATLAVQAGAASLPSPLRWGGEVRWTDGACASPNDQLLARAAWSFVSESGEVCSGPVGGPQTAQRAEIMALLAASLSGSAGLSCGFGVDSVRIRCGFSVDSMWIQK